jgi:trimeric autotransporter adhesin
LNGTLEADSAAAIKGLMGILNGDTGAALAADHAMITAAGQGFAADAMDVSGNNTPIGGGTYVGTATTVATATSVNGLAQGSIPVTATPNIANGTGGTAATPPANTSGNPPAGNPPAGNPPGGNPPANNPPPQQSSGHDDDHGGPQHDACGGCGDHHHDHSHFEMMWHHA